MAVIAHFNRYLFPALSADGLSLFFADSLFTPSRRPGNLGGADLWVSTRANSQEPWRPPVHLGPAVNTGSSDTTPGISSDGLTLVFSSNRPGNVPGSLDGRLDLWMTTRSEATDVLGWGPPLNLGTTINSIYHDAMPNLSANGLTLFFSSDRPNPGRPEGLNNIWVAEAEIFFRAVRPARESWSKFHKFPYHARSVHIR